MIFLFWDNGGTEEFITRGETLEEAYQNMRGITYESPGLAQCEVFSTEPVHLKMSLIFESEPLFEEIKVTKTRANIPRSQKRKVK